MRVLVTGGAGYIGSHTSLELLKAGHQVIVLDNLTNSKLTNLENVSLIAKIKLEINTLKSCNFLFLQGDICDESKLNDIFSKIKIDGVIHFAGLKAVGESVKKPIKYYKNNVSGTLTLLEIMKIFNCKNFVFSSSAAIYGEPHILPIKENFPPKPASPYAESKLMVENLLRDLFLSDQNWHIAILRYFNPIGAHESGLIGENPKGLPNNLLPNIMQVAVGKLKELSIFGDNYNTHDGTAVRDYLHVVDLAKSHVKALAAIKIQEEILTLNLGTGVGHSVFDVIKTFEKISNKKILYRVIDRRKGDIDKNFTDPTLAKEKLGWEAKHNLEKMCIDSWNFQKNNTNY